MTETDIWEALPPRGGVTPLRLSGSLPAQPRQLHAILLLMGSRGSAVEGARGFWRRGRRPSRRPEIA